jgi:recombinational DNA repair ATPase RecF
MPDGPPDIQAVAADGAWPWQRLRNMTIGPFRGFRTPEPFDLQKRIILFYGPNGSGKTSFCEGLEYGLLGSVEEAETKRIDGPTLRQGRSAHLRIDRCQYLLAISSTGLQMDAIT